MLWTLILLIYLALAVFEHTIQLVSLINIIKHNIICGNVTHTVHGFIDRASVEGRFLRFFYVSFDLKKKRKQIHGWASCHSRYVKCCENAWTKMKQHNTQNHTVLWTKNASSLVWVYKKIYRMSAYKWNRIYIDKQVSSEWMHGKRWQLFNNKCILIILLLKHRTKHIFRLMAETCSVLMLVHFDCIHSAARFVFTHENHSAYRCTHRFLYSILFGMHLAVSLDSFWKWSKRISQITK